MSWICHLCNATNTDDASNTCSSCHQTRQIKCNALGCTAWYDITQPRCPQCGTFNTFASRLVKPGHTLCLNCGRNMDNTQEAFCRGCGIPNPAYIIKSSETKCSVCGTVFNINEETCPKGHPNKAKPKLTNLKTATSKKISGRVYEIVAFVLLGIFLIFGLPFFGFPSLILLGIVFIVFIPIGMIIPSENEVISSVKRGQKHFGDEQIGFLVFKGITRFIEFILVVIQFMILPISKLIPLGVSFFYYISLPTSYKTTRPFTMVEAWFKIIVGFAIVFFIFSAFGGAQGESLALMAAAFFCLSPPKHKKAEPIEEDEPKLIMPLYEDYLDKKLKGFNIFNLILNIVFTILMIISAFASGIGFGISGLQLVFDLVWIFSLISGWTAGPEGRPVLGVLMILITLFVFTFTATGMIGQAVFGYWWPQVYSFGESIAAPIAPMWSQVQGGMGSMWLMLTNPMAYYNQMQQTQQATASVVTTGGTTKSIELTKTDLFTSITGTLEPTLDPVIGSFEIQNQGEFDANSIEMTIQALWQDPQNLTNQVPTGSLYTFNCSRPPNNPATFSTAVGGVGNCSWDETTYPNEIKLSTFVFNKDNWSLNATDNLDICQNPAVCTNSNSTYVHAGQIVKFNANITYDYNVNVSIPVEVIDWDTYEKLLEANEITLQELTSQYTGGPVKATLWSQKQPIRAGEVALFVASIYNDGGGNIIEVSNFTIKIPKDLGNVEKVSSTFYTCDPSNPSCDGCSKVLLASGDTEIDCQHTWTDHPIKSGEYKRVSFLVTPSSTMSVDRVTRLITGLANYKYIKTSSQSLTVANNYPH